MSIKKFEELTFSTTETPSLYLESRALSGIQLPDDIAFNSKTMEIQASFDGKNFAPVYDNEGVKLIISLGAKRFIPLFLNDFSSPVYVKFIASESLDGKTITVGYTEIFK